MALFIYFRKKSIPVLDKKKATLFFLLKLFTMYALYMYVWKQFVWNSFLAKPWELLHHFVLKATMAFCLFFLNLFGYEAIEYSYRVIVMVKPNASITVQNYCLGLDVMALFTMLIIAYPGPWKKKLLFIPIGIIGVFIINQLRIMAIGICFVDFIEYAWFDNHLYFNVAAYSFIFLFFVGWVNYLERKNLTGIQD